MADQTASLFNMALLLKVRLSPYFTQNMRVGVENLLNKTLLKYLPEAGGIFLAYENLRLVDNVGQIVHEGCETHFKIRCDALVFRIQPGTLLEGSINKVSSNHIGLLVHGLFNASIPVDELRHGMSFDTDAGCWTIGRESNSDQSIFRVGTRMLFKVLRVRSKTGLVFIAGSQKLSSPKQRAASQELESEERKRQADEDAAHPGPVGDSASVADESDGQDQEDGAPPPTKKAKNAIVAGIADSKKEKKKKKKKEKKKTDKKEHKDKSAQKKRSKGKRKAAEVD